MIVRPLFKRTVFLAGVIALEITIAVNSASQVIVTPENQNEKIFQVRTKQFSEFTARFNYESDFNGNPPDQDFMVRMPREKMLSLLFDLKDPRIVKGNKESDEIYINTKTAFISEITGNKLLVNSHSAGIIGEARTRIIYNGKPQTISLFLNQ
ncbi:MAG: hypothetical protein HZB98_00215, partial [Bacteroidia bacterium]|nr:hypothetical protein [Bacteroidia bacterium]